MDALQALEQIISGKWEDIEQVEHEIYVTGHLSLKELADRIRCDDGFHASVQASEIHYCEPRNNDGPYTTVELGFPGVLLPNDRRALYPYGEFPYDDLYEDGFEREFILKLGDTTWSKIVYVFVPVDIVRQLIARHTLATPARKHRALAALAIALVLLTLLAQALA